MRSQAQLPIEVVGVCGAATHVVRWNEEIVETLLRWHDWAKVLEELEPFPGDAQLRELVLLSVEKVECLINQRRQWVLRILVKLLLGHVKDALWDVREVILHGLVRDVARELSDLITLGKSLNPLGKPRCCQHYLLVCF